MVVNEPPRVAAEPVVGASTVSVTRFLPSVNVPGTDAGTRDGSPALQGWMVMGATGAGAQRARRSGRMLRLYDDVVDAPRCAEDVRRESVHLDRTSP
jgi:hypothetical protein